jgi:hypothetical protein
MTNDYTGQKIEVIRESQNGLYALAVLNGEKLGWVDKRALSDIVIIPKVQDLASASIVDYTARISGKDYSIDSLPWGYPGYAFRYMTNDYTGQKIEVIRESQNGLYAMAVLNGEKLGWVDKRALSDIVIIPKVQDLASASIVDYTARISGKDYSIDSLPWGYAGYMYMGTSTTYLDQKIQAEKETANGQYVLISLNGEKLGWVDKRASVRHRTVSPKVQDVASAICRSTILPASAGADYSIDSLPWGYAGYMYMGTSAAYLDQKIQAEKETANGQYVLISLNGEKLGWIDKRALSDIYSPPKVQDVASALTVDYAARIGSAGFSIDSLPWGYAGYAQMATSTDYLNESVRQSKRPQTASMR